MARVTANTASFSASIDVVAEVSKAAGFDGLEIWERDVLEFSGGAAGLRAALETRGLSLSALQVLRDFEGATGLDRAVKLTEAENLLDMTRATGGDTLLLCANTLATSSSDSDAQVIDLRTLAAMAAGRGVRVAFEPLAWSQWINRYEIALERVEAVDHPALGLALDAFHLFYQASPLDLVDRMPMDRCFLVQLCDAKPMDLSALQIARHHRLLPGEGVWPVAELVRRLEGRGYGGFYNIEVFNDAYKTEPPAAFAARAFASFQALFEPTVVGGRP